MAKAKGIARTLDSEVEAFLDRVEQLLETLDEKLPDDYLGVGAELDSAEKALRELRRRWLAEETARAR